MDGPGTHTNGYNGDVPTTTVVIQLLHYIRSLAKETFEGLPTAVDSTRLSFQ